MKTTSKCHRNSVTKPGVDSSLGWKWSLLAKQKLRSIRNRWSNGKLKYNTLFYIHSFICGFFNDGVNISDCIDQKYLEVLKYGAAEDGDQLDWSCERWRSNTFSQWRET